MKLDLAEINDTVDNKIKVFKLFEILDVTFEFNMQHKVPSVSIIVLIIVKYIFLRLNEVAIQKCKEIILKVFSSEKRTIIDALPF